MGIMGIMDCKRSDRSVASTVSYLDIDLCMASDRKAVTLGGKAVKVPESSFQLVTCCVVA